MKCRNCGQEISPWGKECPWCRTSTQESAYVNVSSWANMAIGMILGAAAGAFIGWSQGGDEDGKIGLAVLFAIVGSLVGGVVGNLKGWNSADKEMSDRHGQQSGQVAGRGCQYCGNDPGYDVRTRPDKYCSNCGKKFGG